MGSYQSEIVPSGYRSLDDELPNGGWPSAALIELLPQQTGIGELRLLRPALRRLVRKSRIVLLQPPHLPQIAAWSAWGLPAEKLLWVRPERSADALWSAEQILRNGSCGALLFWQSRIRTESLRRLHLAAQDSRMVFWMLRPLAEAVQASPAPLRLALRAADGGLAVDIIKRRGPHHDRPLRLMLEDASPAFPSHPASAHAHLDRHPSAAAAARNHPAPLV